MILFYKWKDKDGNVIPIEEMTDDHVGNAIEFLSNLEDLNEKGLEFLAALINERERRKPDGNWMEPS